MDVGQKEEPGHCECSLEIRPLLEPKHNDAWVANEL